MIPNQYGYLPIDKVGLLTQEYQIANPTTWTFERWEAGPEPVQYAGVEEKEFTEAQKTELLALGGGWFLSPQAFNSWLNEFNHD